MDIEATNSFAISNGTHLSFANLAGRTITVDGFSGGCALNGTPGDSLDLNPASAWTLAVNINSLLNASFAKIGNCAATVKPGNGSNGRNIGGNTGWSFFTDISAGLPGVLLGSIAWGDYDNDGYQDILLTGTTDGGPTRISKIFHNNGNGTFTDINAGLTGVARSSVAWGDYDNDGHLDILLTGMTNLNDGTSGITKIYRNNGNGTFTDINVSLPGITSGSVAWGDYDHDGYLDILLTGTDNTGTPISKVYHNNGNGTFSDINAGLIGVSSGSVAWGDYDNDGYLDILLTGTTGGYPYPAISKVYHNNGNGTFTDIGANLAGEGQSPSSVAWGDYDNDGYLDILLSGYNPGYPFFTKIYHNNGDGTFSDINASLAGVYQSSVAWGDYNNDGYLDILLTGGGSGSITSIYHNNGNGTFTDISAGLPGLGYYSSVAWGDFNNDGNLDFILSNGRIYRNDNNLSPNTVPAIPSLVSRTIYRDSVRFVWHKSTDAQTASNGLTYNLRIGTTTGGSQILSPMANAATGLRRVSSMGNMNHDTAWTIKNLPNGRYYYGVQALDNNFAGSSFSAEQSFKIDTMPPDNDVTLHATSLDTGRILLTWTPSNIDSTDADSVGIWYKTTGFPLKANDTTAMLFKKFPKSIESFDTVKNLTKNTLYYFALEVNDTMGNWSRTIASSRDSAWTIVPGVRRWTGSGADSNWSTSGNWSPSGAPVNTDSVVFDGTTIKGCYLDVNATVKALTLLPTFNGSFSFLGDTLSTAGNVDLRTGGAMNAGSGAIVYTGSSLQTFIPDNGEVNPTVIHSGSGTLQLSTNPLTCLAFNQTAGTFDFNGEDIEAANSFTISNGTHLSFANLDQRTITVDFSGSSGCVLNGTPGDSLNLNPASACTLAVNAGSSLNATFAKIGNCVATVAAGMAQNSHDMGGNVNWNFITPNTKYWTGAGGDHNWNTPANWNTGTVPAATDSVVFNSGSADCDLNTSPTVKAIVFTNGYSGMFSFTNQTLTISGSTANFNFGGPFNANTGTLAFAGTSPQYFTPKNPALFPPILQNGTGGTTLLGGLATTGLILSQGTLHLGTSNMITVDSTFTINGGGLDMGSSTLKISASLISFYNLQTFNRGTGSLVFTNSGPQVFSPYSLVMGVNDTLPAIYKQGSGTTTLGAWFQSGQITVNSGILIENNGMACSGLNVSGGTFQQDSNNNVAVSGNLMVNGGTFTANNTKGTFTIYGSVSLGSGTLKAPDSLIVDYGNWDKTGGTFIPGNGTVIFGGNSGGLHINSGGSPFNKISFHTAGGGWGITGSNLKAADTMTLDPGTTLNLGAGFNDSVGTMIVNNATLDFGAVPSTLVTTGNFTIHNGSSGTMADLAGATIKAGGSVNLTGQSGNLLDLNGTAPWYVKAGGTLSASYANIAYSNATGWPAVETLMQHVQTAETIQTGYSSSPTQNSGQEEAQTAIGLPQQTGRRAEHRHQ